MSLREVTYREAIAWAVSRTVESEDTTSFEAVVRFTDGSAIHVESEWTDYGETSGQSADPPTISIEEPEET